MSTNEENEPMFTPDDLREFADANRPEESEPFTINSEKRVDWLLGKIAALDAEIVVVNTNAQAISEGLEAQKASLLTAFEGQLHDFHMRKFLADPRAPKTWKYLHGKVSLTHEGAKVVIKDMDDARRHVMDDMIPGIILLQTTVKEVFDKAAYIALAEPKEIANPDTGEAEIVVKQIPGIDVVPARERMNITAGAIKPRASSARKGPQSPSSDTESGSKEDSE